MALKEVKQVSLRIIVHKSDTILNRSSNTITLTIKPYPVNFQFNKLSSFKNFDS